MSEYDDVKHLTTNGYWPDRTVPDWVEALAKRYDCSLTAPIIFEAAYEAEIERLKEINEGLSNDRRAVAEEADERGKEIERLKGCLAESERQFQAKVAEVVSLQAELDVERKRLDWMLRYCHPVYVVDLLNKTAIKSVEQIDELMAQKPETATERLWRESGEK